MTDIQRKSFGRCLILNQSYEYLAITDWFKAICLEMEAKATALGYYPDIARSQYQEFKIPSVLVIEYYVNKKRRGNFNNVCKRNLLIRDNFRCQYCDTKLTIGTCTVDHVIPRVRGGLNTLENTVSCCKVCNNIKGDMSLKDLALKKGLILKNAPRLLNEDEKIRCILRTVKSKERNAWNEIIEKHKIKLC